MNNDENHYQPISCELYSEYELAIIRSHKIKLVWRDLAQDQINIGVITPLDLQTENHEEFLIGQDHRKQLLRIRLDQIQSQSFFQE